MKTMLLRMAGRLVMLGIALGICLVSAEVVFRVMGWRPLTLFVYEPVVGRWHIPGEVGLYTKEGRVKVRMNSQGLRDREYSVEKPAGVFRIAVLGDSYTEALQVPLAKAFHEIVEGRLNTGGKRVEVISFGIGGIGTAQELLVYRQFARRYRPDVVLVAFTWHNDLADNSKELQRMLEGGWEDRPFFDLKDGKLVLDDSYVELHRQKEAGLEREYRSRGALFALWMNWIKPHSYFLDFLNQQVRFVKWRVQQGGQAGSGGPPFDEIYNIFNPQTPPAWQRAWDITEGILARLRDECKADGAQLAVMEVTFGMHLYPDYRERALYNLWPQTRGFDFEKPCRLLDAMMMRLGVPYLPLTPVFLEDFARTRRYLHGNTINPNAHWNAEGHAIVARDLERFLESYCLSSTTKPSFQEH